MTERTGEWLDTVTGPFYLTDPRDEDIDIVAIAHGLSSICRFGGHTTRFYSVAEHSVHCAAVAPPHLRLSALFHDAAEAYLGDIPSPLKRMLPDYRAVEAVVARAVMRKFGLPWPVPKEVKDIDTRLMVTEASQLSAGRSRPYWLDDHWPPAYPLVLPCWSMEAAFSNFLAAFEGRAYG